MKINIIWNKESLSNKVFIAIKHYEMIIFNLNRVIIKIFKFFYLINNKISKQTNL